MNTLCPTGKGMYIWQVKEADGPTPARYVQAALDAGLSHVIIKFAQGVYGYNTSVDLPEYIAAFKAAGIQVWGFHYIQGGVYYDSSGNMYTDGSTPEAEAQFGAEYALELGLDGYVINAEREYKVHGQHARATRYCARLSAQLNGVIPIALSTYRYPDLHPEFPFAEFIEICNVGMPQVYWMGATNAGWQLDKTLVQWRQRTSVPIVPTGAIFTEHGWTAQPGEVQEFLERCREHELPGCNFWVWQQRVRLPKLWDVVAAFDYYGTMPPLPPLPPLDCCDELALRLDELEARVVMLEHTSPPPLPGETVEMRCIAEPSLRIREIPEFGEVLILIPYGTIVVVSPLQTIADSQGRGNWVRVEYADVRGWTAAWYLEPLSK